MSTLRQALYGIALLGAIALLIWGQQQRIEVADKATELAQQDADRFKGESERNQASADKLGAALADERKSQATLRTQQDLLRQGLATRQHTIEELKRENAELRQWADQLLPDAARRLRERPAITGAAGYRDWLSGRGALPVAGDRAAK